MESMLNKLRSTVSSAASNAVSNAVSIATQVSNYLPGNPVTREYEATEHIASAGRGLMWKVYKGYKKSTKQEAAIFLFEKRQLDNWDRQEKEIMLEKIRKGISQLTRLRHPQVLTVQHPLEESRESFAFATEPVQSSLANILGKHENMPSPLPLYINNYQFYDVEIKYGLMQISEGLGFLHNSVKLVHCAISPENIVLNHQGAWKLFGFDFCVTNQSTPDQPPMWPFEEYESSYHELSQPDMDYLAPEYALTHKLGPSADMFSLGVIIHALYNRGKPVYQNHNDYTIFKTHSSELKCSNKLVMDGIPEDLKEQLKLLLNASPELRPDALQFSKISYFEDIGVKTMTYLDQLFQCDNMQKSQFFKSLPQILPHFPHRVLLLRIVPSLIKECVNPTMVPFVLPLLLHAADKASKEEFIKHILPDLKPIMKITEPIQVMLLLMMKMELLLSKTPADAIRTDILPFLYCAIECDTQQIQELCLSVIPTCASMVDQSTMKNALLPRIKNLCVSTTYLSVRVNSLVCIGKVLEHLDKWLVLDDIFSFLEKVPSREAPVIMAIVGIFKISLYHKKLGISKEVIATKVLPFLFPLSIENSLTPIQYSTVMVLVKDMIERVENEHKVKLERLNFIRNDQQPLEMTLPTSLSPINRNYSTSASSALSDLNDKFSYCKMKPDPSLASQASISSNLYSTQLFSEISLEGQQRLVNQEISRSTFSQKNPQSASLLLMPQLASLPINNRETLYQSHQVNSTISDINNLVKPNLLSSRTVGSPGVNISNHLINNVNITCVKGMSDPTKKKVHIEKIGNLGISPLSQSSQHSSFINSKTMLQQNIVSLQPNSSISFSLNQIPSLGSSLQSPQINSEFKPLSSSDINDLLS